MSDPIETERLYLVLQSADDARAMIRDMRPEDLAELSADWLERVREATTADPWTHGFAMVQKTGEVAVGSCGYKGPPADGTVEIAYAVEPDYRGNGYATEAAAALTAHALRDPNVSLVRAHTLPEASASTRILTKCGFRHVGDVVDPDDGLVWRWETDTAEGP